MKTFILLFTLSFSNLFANKYDCPSSRELRVGKKCYAQLHRLHPTQFAVGMFSVQQKLAEIKSIYVSGQFLDFLKKKVIPVWIGPDQRLYLLDRHHTTLAISKLNIPKSEKRIIVEVVQDFSDLSRSQFYEKLEKVAYLSMTGRGRLPVEDLPQSLDQLRNDPYRSLSTFARESKCYKKVKVNYLEFIWANYFYRQGVKLKPTSELVDYRKNLKFALTRCHIKEASNLPGFYIPKEN